MQIIVLGAHRSGTSLVTRLVNLLGGYVGAEDVALQAAEDNPKGFWERRDTVACNDTILAAAGCTWDQLAGWSFDRTDLQIPPVFSSLMSSAVADLDAHRPWVLKDPRLCLTLPYWRPLLERPVAVVVARDPCEVATSLRTRNGLSFGHALAIYEYSAVGVLTNAANVPTAHISYEAVLADPVGAARQLGQDLAALGVDGLHPPDEAAVREFVDESLYRSRASEDARREMLTPHLQDLDQALRGRPHAVPLPVRPSPVAISAMEAYQGAVRDRARSVALETEREMVTARVTAELASARVALADHAARLSDAAEQVATVTHERDHARLEYTLAATARDQASAEHDVVRQHLDAILRTRYWRMREGVLTWVRGWGVRK